MLVAGAAVLAGSWWLQAHAGGDADGLDRAAFRLLALHRSHRTARIFNAVATDGTDLLVAVLLIVGIGLVQRRRVADAFTLIAGFALTAAAADIAKHLARRPRPPHEVLYAGGYGFPSSSAALAIGFVVLTIVLAPAVGAGRRGHALIAAGTVLGVVISGLVIALRDHYLTDVIAGWGLGASVFAAAALLAPRVSRALGRLRGRAPGAGHE